MIKLVKKRKLENDSEEMVRGSKVYAFANGSVKSNTDLIALIDTLKPKIMNLMDSANSVSYS